MLNTMQVSDWKKRACPIQKAPDFSMFSFTMEMDWADQIWFSNEQDLRQGVLVLRKQALYFRKFRREVRVW